MFRESGKYRTIFSITGVKQDSAGRPLREVECGGTDASHDQSGASNGERVTSRKTNEIWWLGTEFKSGTLSSVGFGVTILRAG